MQDSSVYEDDDMKEAEDDSMSKFMAMVPRLMRKQKIVQSNFRVFELKNIVPININFNDVFELIGREWLLNIYIIQLWCM